MVTRGKIKDIVGRIIFLLILLSAGMVRAEVVNYELTIDKKLIKIGDKLSEVITINNSFPGPVLRFKKGDYAKIKVKNNLEENTSIHWHGILVPPEMDGVPFLNFPPISPKGEFLYEFPIRQEGTYWYHSHSNLQEQLGLYGGIVIDPQENNKNYHKEYVIILSDWSTESPKEILKTLKRGEEWYLIEKGSAQSIVGAIKAGKIKDYLKRDLLRMHPMDISDVAYDYFLANGLPEISLEAKKGERVLIRLINGSSSTNFFLDFAGVNMKIVSADGQDVEPFYEKRFLIAIAETYDFIIEIPDNLSYELRATAQDSSGYASIWVGEGERVYAENVLKPDLYTEMTPFSWRKLFTFDPNEIMGMTDDKVKKGEFDKPGYYHIMGENHKGMHHSHNFVKKDFHSHHKEEKIDGYGRKYKNRFGLLDGDAVLGEQIAMDGFDDRRPYPPYNKLKSVKKTSFDEKLPIQEFRFTLDGDMKKFVWFLNGKALSESDVITIKANHIVRFILINRTMMNHPMHLHGHFFRVINEHGDYSPLKHTVNVAPMSTTVIEFLSDEFGDWFFHCHILYHMKSGMANVIHYEGYTNPSVEPIKKELYKEHNYFLGEIKLLTNLTSGELVLTNTRNSFYLDWEAGWERVSRVDWKTDLYWERYVNQFFSPILGGFLFGEGNETASLRGFAGFKYLFPFNIETKFFLDSSLELKINLKKEFQLFPRLSLKAEIDYYTDGHDDYMIWLNYALQKKITLTANWSSKFSYGLGFIYKL